MNGQNVVTYITRIEKVLEAWEKLGLRVINKALQTELQRIAKAGLLWNLVSSIDIADVAGVGGNAVANWQKRYEDFPTPIARVSHGKVPVWELETVLEWLYSKGRLLRPLEEESPTERTARLVREQDDYEAPALREPPYVHEFLPGNEFCTHCSIHRVRAEQGIGCSA